MEIKNMREKQLIVTRIVERGCIPKFSTVYWEWHQLWPKDFEVNGKQLTIFEQGIVPTKAVGRKEIPLPEECIYLTDVIKNTCEWIERRYDKDKIKNKEQKDDLLKQINEKIMKHRQLCIDAIVQLYYKKELNRQEYKLKYGKNKTSVSQLIKFTLLKKGKDGEWHCATSCNFEQMKSFIKTQGSRRSIPQKGENNNV